MTQALATPALTEATLRQWFVNLWRPSHAEGSYEITAVDGEVPRELHGTLYRNGPSQHVLPEAGAAALHLFDGDGLVHAFRFDDGRVHYTSRFVRNETFLAEERAGAYGFAGFSLPADVPGHEGEMRVQPNTNVLYHAGRLLALVENAPPFEIDARTLAPIGSYDLDGRLLGMSTTAHPKIDGRSGEMVIHGYQPFAPFLQLYVVAPDGRVTLAETVEAPYATMMHDLAISEHHAVFPLTSARMNVEALAAGQPIGDCVFAGEEPLCFGVRARTPGAPVRWFETARPGCMFHFGNAYEDAGRIVFDACVYPDTAGLLDGLRTVRGGGGGAGGLRALPTLFELDLERGTCRETVLSDRSAEFPRCDARRVGHRNRWGYAAVGREDALADVETYFSVLVKYDREGGPSVYHDFGRGTWTGEPVFVPRTPEAEEDDGFVLVVCHDGPNDRTTLAVLDARRFDGAPLATLSVRERIPMGFHGNFAPGVI
jgi:carotenoid cleavage dioxygenase